MVIPPEHGRAIIRSRFTIRAHLATLVLLVALPLMALLGFNIYQRAVDNTQEQTDVSIRIAEQTAGFTEQFIEDIRLTLENLALQHVRLLDPARCKATALTYLSINPLYANLVVRDQDDNPVCAARDGNKLPARAADPESFDRTIRENRFVVGKPLRGPVTGRWVVIARQPLRDKDGAVIGVINLPIDVARLNFHAGGVKMPEGSIITVVERDGTILFRLPDPETWAGKNVRETPIIQPGLAAKRGRARGFGPDGIERLYGYATVPTTDWIVASGIPVATALEPVHDQAARSILLSLTILAAVAGVGMVVMRRITDPVQALARTANAIALGQIDARVAEGGPHEIREVMKTFNRMLDARKVIDNTLRESESRLRLATRAADVGLWDWNLSTNEVYFSPEWKSQLGYREHEIKNHYKEWEDRLHPDDKPGTLAKVAEILKNPGLTYQAEFRLQHKNGSYRWIYTRAELVRDDDDKPFRMLGCQIDITRLKQAVELQVAEKQVLEMIAAAAPLAEILDKVADGVESLSTDALCSILLLDADSIHLHVAAGSSLPAGFNRAIEGRPIGPAAGSCGTAAFRNERVIVTDIATDPLWNDYRELALSNGLQACWSTPINGVDGRVLGTFALYYREPRSPGTDELAFIERWTHITQIGIEQHQNAAALAQHAIQLRKLSQHVLDAEEAERLAISRELHDRVGQNLSALNLNLQIIGGQLPSGTPPALFQRMADARKLTEETVIQIRNVMADLRPAVLDEYGLLAALRNHADDVSVRLGIPVTVQGTDPDPRLPAAVETALFRIVQEALNNIAKHAAAKHAGITCVSIPGRFTVTVTDDGIGFTGTMQRDNPPSWGMLTMSERAEAVGATLHVESETGRGTRVIVELAVPAT